MLVKMCAGQERMFSDVMRSGLCTECYILRFGLNCECCSCVWLPLQIFLWRFSDLQSSAQQQMHHAAWVTDSSVHIKAKASFQTAQFLFFFQLQVLCYELRGMSDQFWQSLSQLNAQNIRKKTIWFRVQAWTKYKMQVTQDTGRKIQKTFLH